MTENDRSIAVTFKQRLASVVELVEVRVFGSRARGDADEHSDLDVFVEVERLDKGLKERILNIAWEVGFELSGHCSSHFQPGRTGKHAPTVLSDR